MSTIDSIEYTIIGLKPGEKTFEELVTETEASRTYLKDGYYTIYPEIVADYDRRVSPTKDCGELLQHGLSSVRDEMDWKDLKDLIGSID